MKQQPSPSLSTLFKDKQLFETALTHRSFIHEDSKRSSFSSNERLEFLGDAVLNFLTASWLYERFPKRSEGELTALRAALVRAKSLAQFAQELSLGPQVRISQSEEQRAARERPALLADTFEALVGAIYLDQGLETVWGFVQPFFEREVERVLTGKVEFDYRTRLQELVQAQANIVPTYQVIATTGPDHRRLFTTQVLIGEKVWGQGSGPTKQAAAQEAARVALETIG